MLALRRLAAFPDAFNDGRQAMPGAREARPAKACNRCLIGRLAQPLDQPHGVDEEGADDRRVQALVVQHQHRFVQPRLRVHDETARARLGLALAQIRRNEALSVHQRQIEMLERCHRTTAAVSR